MAHPDCPSGPAPSGAGPHPARSACTRTGVPLSVWPAIPLPGPCPASLPLVPCPQRWPAAAAAAVITAFTSPGDLVVTPDPAAGVFAAAAAGAGRRARPRPADPAALLAGSCPDAGQAALAVVTACGAPGCAPGAGRPGAAAAGPRVMFAACHRVLAPGGLLAVITNAACHPGHAGDITASARAAGLVYTQHIIAVHAAISGGRLRLPAAAPALPPGSRPAGPHRPVHSDVLLFRLPGGPRPHQAAAAPHPVAMEDGDLRLSVWATAQRDARAQRAGRYLPAATAHPGKMLPAIAATAIARYTQPGDLVADPMCGIGTTLIEAVHLGRDALGVEYEPRWAALAAAGIAHARRQGATGTAQVVCGDARQLAAIAPAPARGKVALIVTSPPYGPSVHGHVRAGAQGVRKFNNRYSRDPVNLAHHGLDALLDGITKILAGCAALLRPGGIVVITARPWRHRGELVDLPSAVIAAGRAAGLTPAERCVALLAGLDGDRLVARPSFFQLDNTRKARARGEPWHLIVHEDLLVLQHRPKCWSSSEHKGPQREPGHPSLAPPHRRAAAHQADGTRAA